MPKEVIERAKSLLVVLERHAASAPTPQLSLFGEGSAVAKEAAVPQAEPARAAPDPLREALHAIEPDQLSPREALAALYRLQELARAEAPT
jgi:DNA mismatch repair protein MutS